MVVALKRKRTKVQSKMFQTTLELTMALRNFEHNYSNSIVNH